MTWSQDDIDEYDRRHQAALDRLLETTPRRKGSPQERRKPVPRPPAPERIAEVSSAVLARRMDAAAETLLKGDGTDMPSEG
jgi:hypothetical protein